MLLIYQVLGALLLAALALLLPFRPSWRRGLRERLGRVPARPEGAGAEAIWIHAASVGEVRAAVPLADALLRELPSCTLLVTTFTVTGRETAALLLGGAGVRVRCRLAPLDWDGIPGRVVRRERPRLVILLETELWPVLIATLGRAGIPLLLANGRISPRSFGRYRRLRGLLAPLLRGVALALARTEEDAERYRRLGLPPERVRVAGNLKHAAAVRPGQAQRREAARERTGAAAGRPVLLAGSLREGECRLLLGVFRRLLEEVPGLLLVLAPRHPARFDPAALAPWEGRWERWSSQAPRFGPGTAVVLLDTIGELADCYASAAVACVGGTWSGHGGHNVLEPAALGVPVVFGPDYRNFEEEGRALLDAGGGFLAPGAEELHALCRGLLLDAGARAAAGRRAGAVVREFGGAVERTVAAVRELLE